MNLNCKHLNTDIKGHVDLKTYQKHELNIQKNSTIYFQIGLIISLLVTYFFMDMKFLAQDLAFNNLNDNNETEIVFTMNDYKIYKEPVKKIERPKVKKIVLTNVFKTVKNNHVIKEPTTVITSTQNTTDKPSVTVINPAKKDESKGIDFVEQVPIFPGCEGFLTNSERKQCMNDKIAKLVRSKFDTSLGERLGLQGKQKFYVQFKIDKTGQVTEIKTTSKHKLLDMEAKRVISKIPKMQPGKQQQKNVSVIYNLPINFQMIH